MTIWRPHPLLRKPGISFPVPSAMSSSRRSQIALSPGFTPGDYETNLVIAGLCMLEIRARQLNNWRSHEPPDVLLFCQPGVPFNTPILLLAATSSIPTTWAVQEIIGKNTWKIGENCIIIIKRHTRSLQLQLHMKRRRKLQRIIQNKVH